jgi:CRP-like cAMP-binding protein
MIIDFDSAVEQSSFFEEFQPKHIDKLMALGTEVHFGPDQIIFKEDDESHHFYIVLSGRVALEAVYAGKTIRLETVYPRDEFGWVAVVSRKRQFQARALEPVSAMQFEVAEVSAACRNNPYFGSAFLERLFNLAVEQLARYRKRLIQALGESK